MKRAKDKRKDKDGLMDDYGWNEFDDMSETGSTESYDEAVERMGGKTGRIFELMTIQ